MKFVLCMKGSVLNALKGNNSDNIVQKRIILESNQECTKGIFTLRKMFSGQKKFKLKHFFKHF